MSCGQGVLSPFNTKNSTVFSKKNYYLFYDFVFITNYYDKAKGYFLGISHCYLLFFIIVAPSEGWEIMQEPFIPVAL